jgi:membrane associated rhomboid family serine protease
MNYGFLAAASPLVLAQLMIPPLSYFIGERSDLPFLDLIYRLLTPPEFFNLKYLHSLMFNPQDLEGDRIYTILSYMFVHGDYSHLFNNLQSFVINGYPVYREFGMIGMYAIFFGSGIVGVLPSSFRTPHQKSQTFVPPQFWRSLQFKRYCGASGGIFGLFGGTNLLTLSRFMKYLHGLKVQIRREKQAGLRTTLKARDLSAGFVALSQLVGAFATIRQQISLANEGIGNIDHAGHVQGFLAGIAITTCLQLWKFSSS